MRKQFRMVVAAVPLILLSFATAQSQNSTTFRVGPEKAVGGITKEEHSARQAELFNWLTANTPSAALDKPIRVELTLQDLDELATPQPRRGVPLRIGLVKSISPVIEISGLQRSQLLRGGGRIAGGVFQETDDGGFVWAATITSPGAIGIRLHFSNFSIPGCRPLLLQP